MSQMQQQQYNTNPPSNMALNYYQDQLTAANTMSNQYPTMGQYPSEQPTRPDVSNSFPTTNEQALNGNGGDQVGNLTAILSQLLKSKSATGESVPNEEAKFEDAETEQQVKELQNSKHSLETAIKKIDNELETSETLLSTGEQKLELFRSFLNRYRDQSQDLDLQEKNGNYVMESLHTENNDLKEDMHKLSDKFLDLEKTEKAGGQLLEVEQNLKTEASGDINALLRSAQRFSERLKEEENKYSQKGEVLAGIEQNIGLSEETQKHLQENIEKEQQRLDSIQALRKQKQLEYELEGVSH